MTIRALDDRLVSQIAAGEVVERPASVVKELIENSVDAGATRVSVAVEQGGMRRIRVADDGAGIARDELALALNRHATSKIDSLDALAQATTLGFRGEALASIGAIAGLELTSRPAGQDRAFAVVAGDEAAPRPAALEPGTSVEVRELFARVPARRKFLRAPATEFRHIQRAFVHLALSRFDVALSLSNDGRSRLQLTRADGPAAMRERIRRLAGTDFESHAIAVDERAADMHLGGWLATPGFSRSQADLQYLFVNGRAVRDKLLAHAIRSAFRDVLHGQRYPAFALYLGMPTPAVDVNVHPAKHEVRFRESRLVHDFVARSVRRALDAAETRPDRARTVSLAASEPAAASPEPGGAPPGTAASGGSAFAAQYRFQEPAPGAVGEPQSPQYPVDGPSPLGVAIGQLHDIYILAENERGLIVVDMHAAHERVLYERLKAEHRAGRVAAKRLLLPAVLEVDAERASAAECHRDALAEIGLELARSGEATVAIEAIPQLLCDQDYLTLARDALAELAGDARAHRVREVIDDVLADVGCKAAIKAGRRLTLAEMNALLADMAQTDRAGHCNHGRPSWAQVERDGLDRLFLRGQ